MTYDFTTTWFARSELKQLLPQYLTQDQPVRILEIGNYEGASTTWFIDNYLSHADARIVAVDPFDIKDTTNPLRPDTEQRFIANLRKCKFPEKCSRVRLYSHEFFAANHDKFDFIYLDGSHDPRDTYRDTVSCMFALKDDGILWIDDYRGADGTVLKQAIDDALHAVQPVIPHTVIHKRYQIAVRRTTVDV